MWFTKVVASRIQGACQLVRYVDDYICLIQHADETQRVIVALRQRFARFGLELHPEKTRVLSFGRFEREHASKENRRPNTFDFLGFTHYCGQNRKGKFILFRQTSRKKFRIKCREINTWLRKIRNYRKTKEWWPVLCAKLRGHYQYYGVNGNMRSLNQFYNLVEKRRTGRSGPPSGGSRTPVSPSSRRWTPSTSRPSPRLSRNRFGN